MNKIIAYNVNTLEILAVFLGEDWKQLYQLVDLQNYDYDEVGITYGNADDGLIYNDEFITCTAPTVEQDGEIRELAWSYADDDIDTLY